MKLSDSYFGHCQEESQSQTGQASAAFEAGCIAALVALDAKPGEYDHPSENALVKAEGLDMFACINFGPAKHFLGHRYDPEHFDKFDVPRLRNWAEQVRRAL